MEALDLRPRLSINGGVFRVASARNLAKTYSRAGLDALNWKATTDE